jgi:hypothetical protein
MTATAELLTATPERVNKITTRFEVHGTDRNRKAAADRIVSTFDHLFEKSTITGEQRDAGERYERDFIRGTHTPGLVSGYGATRSNGTPVSQQARDIDSANPKLDPMERRTFHATRHHNANQAIGATGQEIMTALVQSELNLEQIGRQVLKFNHTAMARGAATTAIRMTLERLMEHYGNQGGRR